MEYDSVVSTAADYFGSLVSSYDSLIRRAVPRYDEMLERLMDYLPSRASTILELGCGTGNLSLALLRRFEHAQITFVAGSSEMLALTRQLIVDQNLDVSLCQFLSTYFENLDFPPESFELVVSSISLHHVRDKRPLYSIAFDSLTPGGALRFADQLRGGTPEIHDENWEQWLRFCRQAGHCTAEEIRSLLDHAAAHDHYTPLEEHFEMLRSAGFRGIDCVWRNWIWGIVSADKPGAALSS